MLNLKFVHFSLAVHEGSFKKLARNVDENYQNAEIDLLLGLPESCVPSIQALLNFAYFLQ